MKQGNEGAAVKELGPIKRNIGMATYEISLYFSKASAENVQDKLRRVIINDYVNGKKMTD